MCGYFCLRFIDFKLAVKKLTDYTNLFSPYDFKKNDDMTFTYLMDASNSIKAIGKTNLSEHTKFRLSEIIGIKNYFHQEINQRKSYSKKLSKYITAFGYIDKILIVLSVTTGGVSIISLASFVGAPGGIGSASFTLIFFLTTGIVKKLLNITRKKSMIKFLCCPKINSIALKL